MDTNINNYSCNEILNILKLNHNFNSEELYGKIIDIINKINNNYSNNDEKNELISFFKDCFIKISKNKGLIISKIMCNKLHISYNDLDTDNINVNNDLDIDNINVNNDLDIDNINVNNFNNNDNINNDNLDNIIDDNLNKYNIIPQKPTNNILPFNNSFNTFNHKYSKGIVNPIKRETITSTLIINSKFINTTNRHNYNINNNIIDYTIELPEPYTNVVSLKLSSVELINSYYPISDYLKTNYFKIITFEYDISSSTPIATKKNVQHFEFVIDDGSYSITELLIFINNKLNNYVTLTGNKSIQAVNINYNNITGKLNFFLNSGIIPDPSNTNYVFGFDIDFSIPDKIRPSYLNFGWLIGFNELYYDFFNSYNFNPNNLYQLGINGMFPINLIGTPYFLIDVDDFNKNNPAVVNYICDSPYSININNLLAKLPNTSSINTMIFEDSSDKIFKTRNYFGPVRIKKLRIRLLDDNGRVINLNSSDFSITLEIIRLN